MRGNIAGDDRPDRGANEVAPAKQSDQPGLSPRQRQYSQEQPNPLATFMQEEEVRHNNGHDALICGRAES
jgi:hypothetical protein